MSPDASPNQPVATVPSRGSRLRASVRLVSALARRGRWGRSLVSLAAVVSAFCLYWVFVVPWIEPQVDFSTDTDGADFDAVADDVSLNDPPREELATWFPEGAWERGQTITLESARARLLLKRYRNRQDGTVEIEPCTIIFLPEQPGTNDLWIRKAVILQAPQGAVLRFDRPIDLRRGSIGNLIGGTLLGPITIRSDVEQPGPSDDLWVEARDAKLTRHAIVSSQPVRFRLGTHQGSGNGLHIELIAGSGSGTRIDGLRWLQLDRDVRMRLDVADLQRRQSAQADAGAGAESVSSPAVEVAEKPPETIAVRSVGPFRFDFEQAVATFRRDVEVVRYQDRQATDTLTGEEVAIHFSPAQNAANGQTSPGGSRQLSSLEPRRLEARGTPVVLRSPASAIEAIGQTMHYDLQSGRGTLEGQRGVLLRRGDSEIRAPMLQFQPGRDGAWGKFSATGPGSLQGRLPDNSAARISARWRESIRFEPHEGVPLVSLEGDAEFSMSGRGRLAGEAIYIWLRETTPPAGKAHQAAAATAKTGREPRGDGFFSSGGRRLEPDRLLARGHVRFDLAQLTGRVDELQAWFEPAAAENVQAVRPQQNANARFRPGRAASVALAATSHTHRVFAGPEWAGRGRHVQPSFVAGVEAHTGRQMPVQTAAFTPGAGGGSAAPSAPSAVAGPAVADESFQSPRFHIQAGTLQVEMRQDSASLRLSALKLRRNVRITELRTEQPGDEPLRLSGELVEMQGSPETGQLVVLEGTPATVSARAMAMQGPRIELDRATSRLFVYGAGRMTLPMDRDLQGQPLNKPEPLEVIWQRRMRFNGQTAWFEQGVRCRLGNHTLQTETMRVDFLTPIDFNRPSSGQRPEVRQFTTSGPVVIRGRTFAQGQLVASEELQARDLQIHRPSGKITAQGPGTLRLVRRGSPAGAFSPPGATISGAAQRPGATADAGLSYLGLEFQRGLSGNLNQRKLAFYDRVVAVFGPVDNWQQQIDPDVFDLPNPPGMLMHCDRFEVAQIQSSQGTHTEFEAVGNTTVESGAFYARAARMRYAEVKDQIVLEGNGRAKAELWRQLRPGAPQSGTTARKILYWRTTGHVEVDDAEQLDLNLLSSQPAPRR